MRHDDYDLVRAALAGDAEARERVARLLGRVTSILRVLNRRFQGALGDHDLEDLEQDVRARVWEKLPEFEGHASFHSWVYPFCKLEYLNRIRRVTSRRRILSTTDRMDVPDLPPESTADGERLRLLLESLDERTRDVILARYFDGLSWTEMVRRFGEKAGALKSRLYRGIQALRRRLLPRPDSSAAPPPAANGAVEPSPATGRREAP